MEEIGKLQTRILRNLRSKNSSFKKKYIDGGYEITRVFISYPDLIIVELQNEENEYINIELSELDMKRWEERGFMMRDLNESTKELNLKYFQTELRLAREINDLVRYKILEYEVELEKRYNKEWEV